MYENKRPSPRIRHRNVDAGLQDTYLARPRTGREDRCPRTPQLSTGAGESLRVRDQTPLNWCWQTKLPTDLVLDRHRWCSTQRATKGGGASFKIIDKLYHVSIIFVCSYLEVQGFPHATSSRTASSSSSLIWRVHALQSTAGSDQHSLDVTAD